MYYSMVMREIPIQCTEFGCPDCKEKENLEYQVESINVEKDNFSFNATISCKKCKTKKSLSKILTNLLKIIKIEVKPTGITLQKAAE